MAEHGHLKRLDRIWVPAAIYFITVCAFDRRSVLVSREAHEILRGEWETARQRYGWLVGRYVVMPDHVHFFCAERAEGAQHRLSRFVGQWKEWTAKELCQAKAIRPPIWQERFFDHLLRTDESYAEKWNYVRENPVRAGLVKAWDEWPWQGAIHFDFPKTISALS